MPVSLWLFTGLFIGLALSWLLYSRGYFPYSDRPAREEAGPISRAGGRAERAQPTGRTRHGR
jgi:hypothetical protein